MAQQHAHQRPAEALGGGQVLRASRECSPPRTVSCQASKEARGWRRLAAGPGHHRLLGIARPGDGARHLRAEPEDEARRAVASSRTASRPLATSAYSAAGGWSRPSRSVWKVPSKGCPASQVASSTTPGAEAWRLRGWGLSEQQRRAARAGEAEQQLRLTGEGRGHASPPARRAAPPGGPGGGRGGRARRTRRRAPRRRAAAPPAGPARHRRGAWRRATRRRVRWWQAMRPHRRAVAQQRDGAWRRPPPCWRGTPGAPGTRCAGPRRTGPSGGPSEGSTAGTSGTGLGARVGDEAQGVARVEGAGLGGDVAGGEVQAQEAVHAVVAALRHHLAVPVRVEAVHHHPVEAGERAHRLRRRLEQPQRALGPGQRREEQVHHRPARPPRGSPSAGRAPAPAPPARRCRCSRPDEEAARGLEAQGAGWRAGTGPG